MDKDYVSYYSSQANKIIKIKSDLVSLCKGKVDF